MEDEVRKHFRGIRILVTLALLAACISFAFSYVLFKEVNIPLQRLQTQELVVLEGKVDHLMTSRLDGRLDVELQAALLTKVTEFVTSMDDQVSVYVLGSRGFAKDLKSAIGRKDGKKRIVSVESGDELPAGSPSILYVGNAKVLDQAIQFCRAHGVLSVTGDPALVKRGISLGFGLDEEDAKPKILINRNASKEENVSWNPAIFKFAIIEE